MPYTKVDQSKFDYLNEGETIVLLDTGDLVGVRAKGWVQDETGNSVVEAFARKVNPDGSDATDANGQTIKSSFNSSMDMGNVKQMGGMPAFQRLMLHTVLGEPAAWINALPQDVLDHASIRTNIAAALHSGDIDTSTLL